jgi:hypothetical protein
VEISPYSNSQSLPASVQSSILSTAYDFRGKVKRIVRCFFIAYIVMLPSIVWSSPIEVRPDKITVSIYDQARLLRLGLEYANGDRKDQVA